MARMLRYGVILQGIANADRARYPAIRGRVYFINRRTNVIMHMYDDRGLDIIAQSKDALDGLYGNFNDWILDHDRARVDLTFAH